MDLKIVQNKIFSNKNILFVAIIIAGILIAGSILYVNKGKFIFLSKEAAANRVIEYVNNSISEQGGTEKATLVSMEEEKGVYLISFTVTEQLYKMYVSKDGKYLFPQALKMSTSTEEGKNNQSSDNNNSAIAKSDKPNVKLFVMSYCPFGLQAEKMYLPVYNLLKDKADMGIYFVNYAMHGKEEIDENLRQYCIQKEQTDKYYNYLSCFVGSGKYQDCLASANVDTAKLNSCQTQADAEYNVTVNYDATSTWLSGRYPKFDINTDLNSQYGVQGSPSVIINDTIIVSKQDDCPQGEGQKCAVVTDFSRNPESFKALICSTFNNPPSECSQALSSEAPSAGFGTATGDSNTNAECGN